MSVTKERIIEAVFRQSELRQKDARFAVESLVSLLKKTLAGEEDILISGFGKFIVRCQKSPALTQPTYQSGYGIGKAPGGGFPDFSDTAAHAQRR